MKLNIIGPAYQDQALSISNQKCVNMFLEETREDGAINSRSLRHTPGLKQMVALGTSAGVGEVRGAIVIDGRMFVVRADEFYELTYNSTTDTMTATLHGTLSSGSTTGVVKMAANPTQIIIVDGSSSGNIFNYSTDTFSAISDADFEGGKTVVYMDSYFIYNKPGGGLMYASASNDGLTFDALDVATAEALPDDTLALELLNNELWVLGESSTEVWYNSANASGFPFSRRNTVVFDTGIGAFASAVKFDNTLMWLSENGQVMQVLAGSYSLIQVSTNSIERRINNFSDFSDAVAFAYNDEGHWFYVLHFPTANETWVYDKLSKSWHQRAWRNQSNGLDERHRSNVYAFFKGQHFVGDWENGKIYRMATDIYTDDGEAIIRERTSAHANLENKRIQFSKITLNVETAVGSATGQGADPHLMFQYSKDAGRTWSNQIFRSIGPIGSYKDQISITRLGQARNWTFRITYSDPTAFTLIDAAAQGMIEDEPNKIL